MVTFLIGIIILVGGGFLYGNYCEKVFGPDDRETPAITKADGVDFVVMKKWKNSLINLLNIAGTGPVLGPIQVYLVRAYCIYYYPYRMRSCRLNA